MACAGCLPVRVGRTGVQDRGMDRNGAGELEVLQVLPERPASVNDPPRVRSGLRLPRQCAQAGGAEKVHAAQVRVNVQDTAGGKLDPPARGAAGPV